MIYFKRIFVVLFGCLVTNVVCLGQETFEITLGGASEEVPYQISRLVDGSYTIMAKTRSFGDGDFDLVLLNIEENGKINWSKIYSSNMRDIARSFITTNDGGYLIAGWKTTVGTKDDWNIIKTDSEGNISWEKFIGGEQDDEIYSVLSIDDYYYLVGSTMNYSNGYAHPYVIKMDSSGNFLWSKIFKAEYHEHCIKIKAADSNSFIIGGYSQSFNSSYNYNFILISIDKEANILWSKAYLSNTNDYYYDLLVTKDNNLLSIGYAIKENGDTDILLIKTNNQGNLLWAKTYGGEFDDKGFQVKEASDGSFVLCGTTQSFGAGSGDMLLIKIDNNGNVIWAKTYGGEEMESYSHFDILQNNGFVIMSSTTSFGNNKDIFLVKTDSLGKSCCYRDEDNFPVKTAPVVEKTVSFDTLSGVSFPNWSIKSFGPVIEENLVCANSFHVKGDSVLCGDMNAITYYIQPDIDGYFTWHVPDGATIVSGQGTSEIVVDFNGTSGYVTASFESYCADKVSDSLFVNLSGGFNISLGPDTTFCDGNTLLLSPGSNYFHYLWQDGSTDSLFVVDASGTYWVQVSDSSGCKAIDSITIDTFPGFDFSIGNDTTICFGDYVFLYAPPGFESYQWQDGSDNTSYIADSSGYYWLEVTDTNNCVARDSMLLTANKVPADILGNDTLFCKDGTFTLRTDSVYEQYFWNNGSNDSVLTTSQPGKYWVTVFDTLGCSGSDTIQLDYFPAITLELNATGQLCEDDSVILQAVSNYNNYLWQDSSQNQTYIAKDSGIYWVKVTTRCETKSDSITIDACSSIWIPNVFTPNNDGYNDYFGAVAKNIIKFKLVIFNRWGQELKTLHSINEKWDGTYRGQKAAQGTYFWVAVYEQVDRNGSAKHIRLQGSVTLIR